uniref:Uncharacterized protein n=1 Tax=Siphoviridae sp. ctDXu9 TaxID=2825387 RepID=A0A8S5VCV8_9CAUD|nr:MAG TPA: hypothetical protein [Siphoviridae sp. ctDXu9]
MTSASQYGITIISKKTERTFVYNWEAGIT